MTDAIRLSLVRRVHAAIYVVMASSVLTAFFASLVGASGFWLIVAMIFVAVEASVFVASEMNCPLLAIAVKYGATPGADTFMSEQVTRHTVNIFGPLIALGLLLIIAFWSGLLR